jgi:acetyl-CoA carboxylase carboxyltransferase component
LFSSRWGCFTCHFRIIHRSWQDINERELDKTLAKDAGKFVAAVACSTVPKISSMNRSLLFGGFVFPSTQPAHVWTVVVGQSVGCVAFAMGGRAAGTQFHFLWPSARVGLEASSLALPGSLAVHAAARLWCDGVITPASTRATILACLQVFRGGFSGGDQPPTPVFRM